MGGHTVPPAPELVEDEVEEAEVEEVVIELEWLEDAALALAPPDPLVEAVARAGPVGEQEQ